KLWVVGAWPFWPLTDIPWTGAEPGAAATDAFRAGATQVIRPAPAKPRPTPAAAPNTPVVTDSAMIWPVTRRVGQPRALSVPNSRTRRDTEVMVRRLAIANAAASTAIDSHRPRLSASSAVSASEPVTALARLSAVVTVAVGTRAL